MFKNTIEETKWCFRFINHISKNEYPMNRFKVGLLKVWSVIIIWGVMPLVNMRYKIIDTFDKLEDLREI